MANPRVLYDYEGIGENLATFASDGSITFNQLNFAGNVNPSPQMNNAVAMSAAHQVSCAVGMLGKYLIGKLKVVEQDGSVAVQYQGFAKMPYLATAPTNYAIPVVGQSVVLDNAGGVCAGGTTAVPFYRNVVVDLDTTNHFAMVLIG